MTGRSAQEEIQQDRCIKVVIGVGLVTFALSLCPIVFFDLKEDTINLSMWIPNHISRIVVVAAALPLLWDFAYDLTLPQRLTYPRTVLLLAILVPNITILLVSIKSLQDPPIKLSICFAFASSQLYDCGLIAYIAGEASSRELLTVLPFAAVYASCRRIFYILQVFGKSSVPPLVVLLVSGLSVLLVVLMMVWYVWDMKTLEERRRMFAMTYVIALGACALFRYASYIVLKHLHMEEYLQDSHLLIEVVIATGVSMISSRMAQHDATIAVVRVQCLGMLTWDVPIYSHRECV